jgi:DNA transformation protein and related proteins
MAVDTEFKNFVLDQLSGMGEFETKNMFGGTAVLRNGAAFAKIKHGSLWLKVDDGNINDFIEKGMVQYTYGKDNSRKLNFYETPADVLEDTVTLIQWASKACEAANRSKK